MNISLRVHIRKWLHKHPKVNPYEFKQNYGPLSTIKTPFGKMYLDRKDSLGLKTNKNFDLLEAEFLKKNIKKGDYVIDVGANIGYYTLMLASLVGKYGKVFSFEPEPNNFKILKKNVKANKYQNVILKNYAVSNFKGTTKLYLAKENFGMHRIFPSNSISSEHVEVKTIVLDDFIKENLDKKPSFIKIDVEGSECKVIEGMNLVLDTQNLKVLCEYVPPNIKDSGDDPLNLLYVFKNKRFEIFYVNNRIHKIEKSIDVIDASKKFYDYRLSDGWSEITNFIFIKN